MVCLHVGNGNVSIVGACWRVVSHRDDDDDAGVPVWIPRPNRSDARLEVDRDAKVR